MAVQQTTGECRIASGGEQALEHALRRALNGNYRQAAITLSQCVDEETVPVSLQSALLALCAGREGEIIESRRHAATALEALYEDDRTALAVDLARSMAWFEYATGAFVPASEYLERARTLAARTGLTHWNHMICTALGHLAVTTGAIQEAVQLLSTGYCERVPCRWAHIAASIELGLLTGDGDLVRAHSSLELVAQAFASGRYFEGYAIAAAIATAWRHGVVEIDAVSMMKLVLRAQADPLAAFEVLVDVAAHGAPADAAEAALLLQSAFRSPQQEMLGACVQLANAYRYMSTQHRSKGAEYGAEAARAFKSIGAVAYQQRAMDALVRTSASFVMGSESDHRLTKRQRQVLVMLRAGHRNRDIAQTLGIAEHTVERHVSVILDELHLRSRWQLVD
ncbi:MAG TPA: helix-turn-helix transcriptional regulator [Candidatus Baltobacteraceae bacterium]|jgi:DNA-binding CsgD family transcriptional regulator|nr:helix-turn-helix transcriptional regulator [Candidatus Baltobacteraceae bacterium]